MTDCARTRTGRLLNLAALLLMLCCQGAPALPPLTEDEAEQLQTGLGPDLTVRDGAFEALISNVSRWSPKSAAETRDQTPPLTPERIGSLQAGESAVLKGDLLRVERMLPPFEDVQRWVLAMPDAEAADAEIVVVFLLADEKPAAAEGGPTPRVRIPVRFYKTMRLPSNGEMRPYPAFVGAHAGLGVGLSERTPQTMPLLFLPVLLGMGLLLVLLFISIAMKSRVSARRFADADDLSMYDPANPLPADPARALGELAKRAEEAP